MCFPEPQVDIKKIKKKYHAELEKYKGNMP